MASNVIVEFTVKGTEKATEQLNKTAQQFQKIEATSKSALDELQKEIESTGDTTKAFNNVLEKAKKSLKGFGEGSKEYAKLQKEIRAAEIATNNLGESEDRLKQRFRALQGDIGILLQRLGKMRQEGLQGTAAFKSLELQIKKLESEAGQLSDEIGDINARIKTLGSDTRSIDGLISGVSGVVGAFQVAEGAAALFGSENVDLQKTMVKLTALMNISTGLQQAYNLTLAESPARIAATSAAQAAYTAVVGTSTGAMKALRLAFAATGIGLLVIGLVTLITNFDKVKAKVLELVPQLGGMGNTFDTVKQKISGFGRAALTVAFDVAKIYFNLGKALFSALTFDPKNAKESLKNAFDTFKGIGEDAARAYKTGVDNEIGRQKESAARRLLESEIDTLERRKKILEAGGKDTYNIEKRILDNKIALEKKGTKEYLDLLAERNALIAARNRDNEKNTKTNLERLKDEVSKQFKELENIVVDSSGNLTGTDIADKLLSIERLKENIKKAEDALTLLYQSEDEKRATQLRTDVSYTSARLLEVEKGSKEEIKLKGDLLILQADLEELAAIKSIENEKERAAKIIEIQTKLKGDLIALDPTNPEPFKNPPLFKIGGNRPSQSIDESGNIVGLSPEDVAKKKFQDNAQLVQQYGGEAFNIAAGFLNAEMQMIEQKKQLELNAIDATSKSKAEKEKLKAAAVAKYAKEEAAIKRKQAIADKAKAIFEIGINTAIAITSALRNSVTAPFLVPIIAGLAAAQLALAIATPIPKFAKGGKVSGKSHAQGGVMAELEGDEYVLRRDAVRKLGIKNLDLLNSGKVVPFVQNMMLKHAMPNYDSIKKVAGMPAVTVNIDSMKGEMKDLKGEMQWLTRYMSDNRSNTDKANVLLGSINRNLTLQKAS